MVKTSYCHRENLEYVAPLHSKQFLTLCKDGCYFGCHCLVRDECPLKIKYLTPNTLYEAKFSNKTNNESKRYDRASEIQFKEKFRNHT